MQKRKLEEKIYEDIRLALLGGTYQTNEYLPSIGEFTTMYAVGRNTIRSALRLLEEDGFIDQEKGRNAKVRFDLNDERYFHQFLTHVMGKAPFLQDVYHCMSLIIPEFAFHCLSTADASEHEKLKQMIRGIRATKLDESRMWTRKLGDFYRYVFSIGHNVLLSDLFSTMLRYIYIALPSSVLKQGMTKEIETYLPKQITGILSHLIVGEFEEMKAAIKQFLVEFSKGADALFLPYLQHAQKVTPVPFHWECRDIHECLYGHVITHIVKDIDQGIYQDRDELPSLQQLAKQYHVSLRTIKQAVKVLNDYHIVQTINGVGSIVTLTHDTKQTIVFDESVKGYIQDFTYANEVLLLCVKGIEHEFYETLEDEERYQIMEELQTQDHRLTPLLTHMLSRSPCLQELMRELSLHLQWNLCIQHLISKEVLSLDFNALKQKMIQALKEKEYSKCKEITHELLECALDMGRSALDKVQGV